MVDLHVLGPGELNVFQSYAHPNCSTRFSPSKQQRELKLHTHGLYIVCSIFGGLAYTTYARKHGSYADIFCLLTFSLSNLFGLVDMFSRSLCTSFVNENRWRIKRVEVLQPELFLMISFSQCSHVMFLLAFRFYLFSGQKLIMSII